MYRFSLLLLIMAAACRTEQDPAPANPTRLATITTYLLDNHGQFKPGEKTVFTYSQDKIIDKKQYSYDVVSKDFWLFSTTHFHYDDSRVKKLETVIESANQRSTTEYEYTNGRLTKITVDDVVDTEATIQHIADNIIEIRYQNSNGRFFNYRIRLENSDISDEEVFDDSQTLSSKQSHSYDSHRNPYQLLGYMDLFLAYMSPNNKLSSESEYFGSYPTAVPISYQYQYNSSDLPTEQVTTYANYLDPGITTQIKTVFEYQ